ncbi:ribonuclease J [Oryzibacter oryziterrae]|uniref:ribonuclease J n=1 Tax=Oryzibacter oryziterrae TaxID=2766474 RepID=UPI0028BEB48D|nr:ribonuclease J [Oryzibacter oryziterrae]
MAVKKIKGASELVFLPLGGVGEIGMNLALYGLGPEHERKWLMVDCGVSFAGPELPGVDLILPDIRFIEAHKEDLVGILITHAHEDHYGALYDLWPALEVPVYMTPFAAALHTAKREMEPHAPRIPTSVVTQGQRFSIGPFDLELIAMSHSLPEPTAVLIRTPMGNVLHTGDWKIDHDPRVGEPINLVRLAEIGAEGVHAMVCDSTNAPRPGRSPSEGEVAHGMAEVIARAKKRVAVTIFASNVGRIRSVAEAAAANDREVIVVGRAIKRVLDVAGELGMLKGLPAFRDEEAYGYLPPDKVVALVTGSQGEARAALAKIAADEHRNVTLSRGDMVIFSSRTIPGNEKAVGAIKNKLVEQGVEIVGDGDALVHTSGHPRRDEMMELYHLVKPKVAVPVHGEALHLAAHAALAREAGVEHVVRTKNGEMVRLLPGDRPDVVDHVPFGILVKDGYLVRDPEASGVNERRKMSFAGVVVATLVMNGKGEVMAEYGLTSFGLPETDDKGEDMEDVLAKAIDGCIDSIPKGRRKDEDMVAEAVRRSIRAAANERWGKKPLCEVTVLRVD